MFWIGITVTVLVIFFFTWMGARFFSDGPPRGRDPEDRAVLPMADEDGPML